MELEQRQNDTASFIVNAAGLVSACALPEEPMAPLADDELPRGDDWGFQLKWDGVRIIAKINSGGSVELYSRSMYLKNAKYPEIADLLESKADELGPCILDGEVVWWDGLRPKFQEVLKRERSAGVISRQRSPQHPPTGGLVYVLFDLLADINGDLRHLPYAERHSRLSQLCPRGNGRLFVADLYTDGEALWQWVQRNCWEGVVSKRLSSPYRQGKKHRDWFKKKTALLMDVDIVGLKWRNGIIASLIMSYDGSYTGSVSLGLNDALRKVIAAIFNSGLEPPVAQVPCPFNVLPTELKNEHVQWLPLSFRCRVTGLERTSAGLIRHPKLVTFLPKEPLP
ncbi:DNA ligase [Paenibacillus sp. sptzw28]|uniref:ATP-dependent DNA ligase n=1 Tax=Paenibacillus sp. sptzw28 TaxID=715179 RepID=UPI001C6EE874|nr:DNA ligase [Paenibacillus sp. sptzw28]QYR20860.1 DNA ligase [Paenibacillus sp. sptzw28]